MKIFGADTLAFRIEQEPARQFKAVLNEEGIIIFSAMTQHSTMKQSGISYEDDYRGNALAAVLDGTKCEIRWHRDFSAERVKAIWSALTQNPDLSPLISLRVSYRGEVLPIRAV